MSPLAPISPWPPEEPAAPYPDLPVAKEVYGLLGVLLTYLAFGAYLVWAFAPSRWLDAVGWTWYPSRSAEEYRQYLTAENGQSSCRAGSWS
jgi:fatty acid desaturase